MAKQSAIEQDGTIVESLSNAMFRVELENSDKNAATNAAKATYGLVTDNRGHKIWVFEENYN